MEAQHGSESARPRLVDFLDKNMETARLYLLELVEALRFLLKEGVSAAWVKTREEIRYLWGRFTPFDFIFGNLSLGALLFGGAVCLSGVGVLAWQTFFWLRDGVWNAVPLMTVFDFLFEGSSLHSWMAQPDSWLGLHQLIQWNLENIPLSLVLIVDGIGFMVLTSGFMVLALMFRRLQFKQMGSN